ncbi:MAG: hypothetical protein KDE31_37005, partial [Caldilineaceae bacterium]|nr:hypothetical protein [Caldilineaceae bacterium]
TIEVLVQPLTTGDQQAAALATFEALIDQLRVAADPAIALDWQPVATVAAATDTAQAATRTVALGTLRVDAPNDRTFASLTTAMPFTPEWSLLYTLLYQLQPTVDTDRVGWLKQSTALRLALDFQAVDQAWQQVALNLEAQAAQLETEAAARNTRDANEAELALRARIQAANYRTTAQEWRTLAQNSWVLVELTIPTGLQPPTRSWLLTPQSPSRVVALQSAPSYVAALIGVIVLGLGGLLLLSGLLWWLL